MKRFIIFFSIMLFCCSIFVSCPCDCHLRYKEIQGKVINEYPDWCATFENNGEKVKGAETNCFGYSDWIDWQSNVGKLFHNLVDDKIISDDYSGKFRIALMGQLLSICFNDVDSKHADFFQYIGPYTDFYKDRLFEIDVNSDKVEYDCWLRKGTGGTAFKDKCQDSNKAKVKMEKIDNSKFNYSLTVASEEIINVEMKNQSNKPQKAILPKSYSWFPTYGFTEVVGNDYWSNGYYGRFIGLHFDSKDNSVELWWRCLHCFEGISLRSVDEENKKISFWLEDREHSDFADYFEIHITKEDWTDEPKRGADKDNKSLMKGTLGFYKEGNSTPIIFYDEEHSEFSRLVD